MQECPICIENVTPTKRIECIYCEYTTCKSCAQKYILNSSNDASCMNCHKTFDRESMTNMFSKNFVTKEYKKHRENILFERETAMMPNTQNLVKRELVRREHQANIDKLHEEKQKLKRKIWEIDETTRGLYLQMQVQTREDTEKKQFIHRCSQQNCRGFLSSAWKCEICKLYTCSECNAPRGENKNDDNHICDENERKSFQMIKNDCKKCPKCCTFIHKISGCDAMWCTGCQTSFSWRTGQEINGQIHNPHYFEFLRQGNGRLNRDHGDIPCGGRPTHSEISRFVRNLGQVYPSELSKFLSFHRLVLHIDDVERPRYDVRITENMNSDIRILYMLNEMKDSEFKSSIQKREKSYTKKRDILMVLQMLIDTMGDFMRRAILNSELIGPLEDCIRLSAYANNEMKKISKLYDCVVPIIDFWGRANGVHLASLKHQAICALYTTHELGAR